MRNFTNKSGLIRMCLLSFILFCSVFASQNAYSGVHWMKDFMKIDYNPQTRLVKFVFVYYVNSPKHSTDAFLKRSLVKYSEDDVTYKPLMRFSTEKQTLDKEIETKLWGKKLGQDIRLFHNLFPIKGTSWHDLENEIYAWNDPVVEKVRVDGKLKNTALCRMTVQWQLPTTARPIKSIRFVGDWKVLGERYPDKIDRIYYLSNVKMNSNVEKNTPLELNSEISSQMTVNGEEDTINVAGVVEGQYIQVYTNVGVPVKSVVANKNVVNIKLARNQKYIVKIGEETYKVEL